MSLFPPPSPHPPLVGTLTSELDGHRYHGGASFLLSPLHSTFTLCTRTVMCCAAHSTDRKEEEIDKDGAGLGRNGGGRWEGGTAPRRVVSTCVSFITRVETVVLVFFFFYFCARPLFTTGEGRSRLL